MGAQLINCCEEEIIDLKCLLQFNSGLGTADIKLITVLFPTLFCPVNIAYNACDYF